MNWEPWTGCKPYSEGCKFCYFYGGNVIYVNSKEKMVIVIASYFQKKAADRMKLIKDYIEPVFFGR